MARIIDVVLPTFHPGQVRAFKVPGRFKVVRCGRRWGKTDYGKVIAADGAVKGQPIGWMAPDYRIMSEAYNEVLDVLAPIVSRSSKTEGVIRTITGGRIDFWTLENERAGRSRKYKKVLIDEAAFTKPNMMSIWEKSIKPTLLDLRGSCTVMSNTNGIADDNFMYQICTNPKYGFVEYHAPTHENPFLPKEELEKLILENHPLVYKQEYLAEFVDWSGIQFFDLQSCLVDGAPVAYPASCDAVFATIDTAVKTGKENDATGVTYWAYVKWPTPMLFVLDWDLVQIEGALLESWLPGVFQTLERFAKECKARMGSVGAHIEDKASGMILLQQAKRRGWAAHPIDSKLTSVGKDERCISVSGYVYRKLVRLTKPAYDKVAQYKGHTRNSFLKQVFGYRIGVKDQEDDLLDTFTYGIAITMGNAEGF